MNSFTIPHSLPTLNEYIEVERANRYAAANMKARTQELIATHLQKLRLKKTALYDVELVWTSANRRKDSDNIFFAIKFILDACVNSKKLAGDGAKYVRNISHERTYGTHDCVTVSFVEVKE